MSTPPPPSPSPPSTPGGASRQGSKSRSASPKSPKKTQKKFFDRGEDDPVRGMAELSLLNEAQLRDPETGPNYHEFKKMYPCDSTRWTPKQTEQLFGFRVTSRRMPYTQISLKLGRSTLACRLRICNLCAGRVRYRGVERLDLSQLGDQTKKMKPPPPPPQQQQRSASSRACSQPRGRKASQRIIVPATAAAAAAAERAQHERELDAASALAAMAHIDHAPPPTTLTAPASPAAVTDRDRDATKAKMSLRGILN